MTALSLCVCSFSLCALSLSVCVLFLFVTVLFLSVCVLFLSLCVCVYSFSLSLCFFSHCVSSLSGCVWCSLSLCVQDWHELISYTCTTLGQSLLASILDHPSLLEHLVRMDHISPPFDESSPSMIKEGPAPLTHETSDEYARNIESMLEKLRFPNHVQVGDRTTKKKLERTTSLPPLRHFRIGVSEPEGSGTILNEHGDFHYQLKHNREEVYGKHISDRADFCRAPRDGSELQQSPIQRTPMEGEGKKCMRDRERPNGRNHTNCLHGRHHSSHGKKMRGRSRSDSVRDPRSHVDTSLDDDCPGIPENRIRRPKHHHQHQHFVCKQCTEEFGPSPWNRGKLTKKGWCRKHSPDHENVNSSGSGSERTLVGPVVFMTPEDMQMATLLLERSTELGKESDNEENVGKGYEDSSSKIDGHTSQHHSGSAGVLHDTKHHGHTSQHHSGSAGVLHDTKHHGHTSQHHSGSAGVLHGTKHHLKINNNSCLPNGRMVTPKEASERHEIVDWSDLPVTSNRSGRDSPATDMAVACLDMNSPRMLQPLGGRSQGLPEQGEVRHMYFHNHQHYHHFIHHSQP